VSRRLALTLFLLAVVLQVGILVGVPARKAVVRWTGRTIYLPIRPVDPYSMLSGYYASLGYEISNPWTDGEKIAEFRKGTDVYVVLEPGSDNLWHPARYSWDRPPDSVSSNQVLLKGKHTGWQRIEYGIEEFYLPETRRGELDKLLRDRTIVPFAEVKVDRNGNAALVSLRAGKATFE
jgi:uncharacterized membrane-anchored protein